MPRPRPYTDDELRDAVRTSQSLLQICRRLGIPPGGETYAALRRNIASLDIDADHLPRAVKHRARPPRTLSDDDLRAAVAANVTISGILRALGYRPSGGMHRYIVARIKAAGLDTSHLVGRAWSRGRRVENARRRPLSEILVANSTFYSSGRLRERLVREGLKAPRCESCGIDSWRGEPLSLALDHVNGDPSDNRIENLRILCPNCHALTDTWCGRRRPRTRAADDG